MPAMTRPDPQQLARWLTRRDRHGWSWVELSARSVLCESMARCAELLEPIAEQLRKEVLASPVVHTDDTPVTLAMPQSSQGGSRQARVWGYLHRGGRHRDEVTQSRKRDGPARVATA